MKRICLIAVVLAVCFGVFLSGCGEKKKEAIKIGAILPLTGVIASAGEDSKNGLSIAVEHANQKLISYNKKIELFVEDSKAQAKDAVSAVNKLTSINNVSVIYCQLTNTSLAVKPIVEKNKQLMFSVSGADELTKGSEYVYRNYINPFQYAEVTSQILKNSLNITQIGIFYANSEFGESIRKNIFNAFSNDNIKVDFQTTFDERQEDYKSIISKILLTNKNTHSIYVIGVGKSLGILIRQLRELNYQGNIIGGIELPYPDVINNIDNKDDIYYVDFAFDIDKNNLTLTAQKFIADYKAKYHTNPNSSSAIAYDAINLFVRSIIDKQNVNYLTMPIEGVTGYIYVKNNEIYYELGLKKLKK